MEIQKVIKRDDHYIVNDQFAIPHDESNAYFKQILEWKKNGGVIEEFQHNIEELFFVKCDNLKQSRSELLSSSKFSIVLNDVSTEFDLHASDLPILQGRVDILANNTDTLSWNDNQGNRVQLNKEAFRSLIRHIQVNDISTWDLYSKKLEELKSLKELGDLEGIKNFNTNL